MTASWVPSEVSPLALAFIGDAVWELFVRDRLLSSGVRRPKELHLAATRYVRASAQAQLAELLQDHLTEAEKDILRRGRNSKSMHTRKNSDVLDYRHSTGFEALIGYLYGNADHERLSAICTLSMDLIEGTMRG